MLVCVCALPHMFSLALQLPPARHVRRRDRKEGGGLLGQDRPDLSQELSLGSRKHSFHHHGNGGVSGGWAARANQKAA